MTLELCPVSLTEASAFVAVHHRHHGPPQGGLFAVAIAAGDAIVGVAIIGRPIAAALQNGYTAEVTRVCVLEGHPNGCSMLYGASWRAARALGYRRLITYTLTREPGSSLAGAGWRVVGETRARSWEKDNPSRPRVDKSPPAQRRLWERVV